jgi:hypothetical protein
VKGGEAQVGRTCPTWGDSSSESAFSRAKERLNKSRFVIPAQAGIQENQGTNWMPACAGMTDILGFTAVFMRK